MTPTLRDRRSQKTASHAFNGLQVASDHDSSTHCTCTCRAYKKVSAQWVTVHNGVINPDVTPYSRRLLVHALLSDTSSQSCRLHHSLTSETDWLTDVDDSLPTSTLHSLHLTCLHRMFYSLLGRIKCVRCGLLWSMIPVSVSLSRGQTVKKRLDASTFCLKRTLPRPKKHCIE